MQKCSTPTKSSLRVGDVKDEHFNSAIDYNDVTVSKPELD